MNRLLTAVVAAAGFWAAACSSGGGVTINPPPPSGNFTLASLKGTYAFMTSGRVITNTTTGPAESSLSRVGSFVADGAGHISGGVEDVNASGTVNTAIPFDSTSSYTINADGRGTLTLNGTSNAVPFSINFAIVLTSGKSGTAPATDGLMIDETSTTNQASTGSGNFMLQNTSAFQTSSITGTYVFDFSGVDASGLPESIVGQVTASSGAITGGFEDANDGLALSGQRPTGAGSFTADPANSGTLSSFGRGIATFAGETFAFYIVDPTTRVRLISIGTGAPTPPMLTGDAVLQSAPPASLNGGFVFLVGGSDANGNGLVRVGRFTAAGAALSKMLMDVNDNASENQFNSLSNGTISSYDSSTGRGVLSFQQGSTLTFSFVFYLSSANNGVIQEVSAPAGSATAIAVADGSIAAQSGSPFTSTSISGTYALNWSGQVTSSNTTDEEDLVAQGTITSLAFTGTYDSFTFASSTISPVTDKGIGATVSFNGGDGAGDDGKSVSMVVNLSQTSPINTVVYIVSPQLAFFTNTSQSGPPRIVAGVLEAQQ